MKITKFIISNYKGVEFFEGAPEGGSFFLTGSNGQGKTTVGHALVDILTKRFPSRPIKNGERMGFIEFTMDDGSKIAAKLFDDDKPKVEFILPDGTKAKTVSALYKQLAGNGGMAFDVNEFLALRPLERARKLQAIAGLNVEDFDAAEKMAEETRRLKKGLMRDQQSRVQPYDAKLAAMEPKVIADLMSNVEAQRDKIRGYESAALLVEHSKDTVEALTAQLKSAKTSLKAATAKAVTPAKMEQEQTTLEQLEADSLSSVDDNAAIVTAGRLKVEEDRYFELEAEVEACEAEVAKIREQRSEKIRSATLPAEGLTFDEVTGGLLLHGLPFEGEQVSSSERLVAGIQIAESQLGDVRFIHLDGSILDSKHADNVLAFAKANDLQLCIERVIWDADDEDGVKFEVYQDEADAK